MQLVEQGTVRLNDSVASWVPGFERYGKGGITVRHLLTHVSGLRPDVDLGEPWKGYDAAIELAANEVPTSPPGERFVYSDINFFLLGDIVARAIGEPLEQYVTRHIFEPLGMTDTGFQPPLERLGRIAPTERCRFLDAWPCKAPEAAPLRGVVHDPTARRMGGVAGHAGLFGTARDLSRFARMLLGGGALGPRRVLAPLTVAKMITPATPAGMARVAASAGTSTRASRRTAASCSRSARSATPASPARRSGSIRATRLFVIFLSSRLHPDGKGDVTPLRARVATIAAVGRHRRRRARRPDRACAPPAPTSAPRPIPRRPVPAAPPTTRVLTGIDVLARDGFAPLKGRKVGLVTNHTGRAANGTTDDRPAAQGARRVSWWRSSAPSTASAAFSTRTSRRRRTSRPDCRSTRSTATRAGPPTRCCRASTRSSSISRTSARASTPTRRRWAT